MTKRLNTKIKILSGGLGSTPVLQPIDPKDIGTVTIDPTGEFEAGSYQTFKWIYKAGTYGIDDSGSIRICFRFASDQGKPQFERPSEPNYTTIVASNNAILKYDYDPKGNVRPWDKTIYIRIVEGYLTEGDTITVTFGDKSAGSPGIRVQTFCEESYEFHSLIDPISTRCYQPVINQPTIKIIPGNPERFVAVAPTLRRTNQEFSIKFKGEDLWGNPSNKCQETFYLKSNLPIHGLPSKVSIQNGEFASSIDGLYVSEECELEIVFFNKQGNFKFKTNPIVIKESEDLIHFWGDLHGQSEETIGTGSAEEYFNFAKNKAFVDITAHQGNDFQISGEFWKQLDSLCSKFDKKGSFVAIPGYEWSGNTSLGGDRNVFFPNEGRTIRRSSHALLSDHSDIETDCTTTNDLFNALEAGKEFDTLMYAHCGGRYADIKLAHDGRFEKSVEVHSSWGSFEWIVNDAFECGYRVGIVGNSDGHKGRPGASYPGSSMFGAIGGLTCFLVPELSRENILDCIRKRRHYATSGGPTGRMHIDLKANFTEPANVFHDDPKLFKPKSMESKHALMGDIVHLPNGEAEIDLIINAAAPIERIDVFNGLKHLETLRPYEESELGNRIRVIWEGAEYRGRFRQVIWDGNANITQNTIVSSNAINFFNKDKELKLLSKTSLEWKALTTGNIGGFDFWLKDSKKGKLKINTPLIQAEIPIEEIGLKDIIFDKSSVLPRYLKVFRMPSEGKYNKISIKRKININNSGDNPIFIRLIQEDGTIAWTSPIYIFREM